MRKVTYEMLHDRYAHEIERPFEVLFAMAAAIMVLYTVIYVF
jgi:hypothetical protein